MKITGQLIHRTTVLVQQRKSSCNKIHTLCLNQLLQHCSAESLRFSTSRTGVSITGEDKKDHWILQAWSKWLDHHTKVTAGQPALHTVGVPSVPTFPQPSAPRKAAQLFGLKNNRVTPECKSIDISG